MNIVSIIVTYKSDLNALNKTILTLKSQVSSIIVVNNDSQQKLDFTDITVINCEKNVGIAAAQNIGIREAFNRRADFILFSDQDTNFPDNYITTLLGKLGKYKIEEIGSIAPSFINLVNNQKSYFYEIQNKKFIKSFYDKGIHEVFYTISSGQIIPVQALKKIGLMNELLFIDWVDIEWCIRAYNYGLKNLQDAETFIYHNLGDKNHTVKRMNIVKHSQVRNKYLIRNGEYLRLFSEFPNFQRKIIRNILIRNILGILITYKKNLIGELILVKKSLRLGKLKKMGRIDE